MPLKIFHIADVHIGMKFSIYPQEIRSCLVNARFEALEKAVEQADQRGADLFIIAGDLFESLKISHMEMKRVRDILSLFQGGQALILPGNHDYFDSEMDFWQKFSKDLPDSIHILCECERTFLQIREYTVSIFSAPCNKKHSSENRLDWIREMDLKADNINILIAHGAIVEWSIDLHNQYFPMRLAELEALGMDLCLTGHTHRPYPGEGNSLLTRVFNSGTPEPDGMNYPYEGSGFYIEIDQEKKIRYEKVILGQYRFFDHSFLCHEDSNLENLLENYKSYDLSKVLLRMKFSGYLKKEIYETRNELFDHFKLRFAFFCFDDHELKVHFTQEILDKEFVKDSLPYRFLKNVLEQEDESTAHLAYELMKEVQVHD